MLLKLSGHITNCLERAASAEQRALDSTDPATRTDNEMLAQSWRHLARSYEFVESLERFLSDTGRNKREVLPPELLAIVEEQPAVKEQPAAPKQIIPRRRIKHQLSFKDRLLKSAQDARREADKLPVGPARDRLLLKAQQSETAADMDVWISTPGSRPPARLDLARKPKA